MTTELEKQFFDTFGIEPKKGCTAYDKLTEEEAEIVTELYAEWVKEQEQDDD